ncbi:MAG: hydroxyacid dehydrogenase [Microbacterium sp.]
MTNLDQRHASAAAPQVAYAMLPDLVGKLITSEASQALSSAGRVYPHVISDWSLEDPRTLESIEVLITGWGAPIIDGRVLDALPRLRGIAHAAGSVKTHLRSEVWDRGIVVTSAAEANAIPVAEFTLSMILLAGKEAIWISRAYRAGGEIHLLREYPHIGNSRRTVAIVGASRIGRRVIELLKPFDFTVLVVDPFLPNGSDLDGATSTPLEEALRRADIVSLHAPELPSTNGMIGARELALMRDGATLINTARASLVDHDALGSELRRGRIYAILDTTAPERLPPESVFLRSANALVTPHLAGAQGTELYRLGDEAVRQAVRMLRGESIPEAITAETLRWSA